jgi:hypothetical protein
MELLSKSYPTKEKTLKGMLDKEQLAILPLSFVGFTSMPSDPQIIDTDGPTSHRHGMA